MNFSLQTTLTAVYYLSLAGAFISAIAFFRSTTRAGQLLFVILSFAVCIELLRYLINEGSVIEFLGIPCTRDSTRYWDHQLIGIMVLVEMCVYGIMALDRPFSGSRSIPNWAWILISVIIFLVSRHAVYGHRFLNYILACLSSSCFAIYALARLLSSEKTVKLTQQADFWFWSIILVYQCSTLVFWGLQPMLHKPYPDTKIAWQLAENARVRNTAIIIGHGHAVLNILQYLGIALVYWQRSAKH